MLNAYAKAEKFKADTRDDPAFSMVFDSEISPQTLYDSFSAATVNQPKQQMAAEGSYG